MAEYPEKLIRETMNNALAHRATRCGCYGWQSAGCPDCCSTPRRATRERIGLLIPFRHGGAPQAESVPQNRARLRRAKGKRVKEQRVNQYPPQRCAGDQRLTWDDIGLESRKVTVSPEVSKTGHRRVNDIPANAWEWLRLCKGTGRIAPKDHIQHMKRLRQRCKAAHRFAIPQNAMRHCFCSYHIAEHKSADKTAIMLGHPNAALLYRTYYELVKAEDAHRFWRVVPASVKPAWDERAKQEAAQARLAAIKEHLQQQQNQL